MNELIKITETNGQRAVSARELYKFLEVTERFSSWFERQLQFGFVENQDYTSVKSFTVVGNGAEKPIEDYALTIDCAKEISMLQRNERGKQARQYFIACEKKYRNGSNTKQQIGFKEKMAAASWAAKFLNLNENSKLKIAHEILAPMNLPLPEYTPSKGQLLSAKALLEQNGIGLSSQQFNQKMMEKGLMTELSRPSSKGLIKHFKSLTSEASEYGENQVNPSNPKETQPLYYADKFTNLLSMLGIAN